VLEGYVDFGIFEQELQDNGWT